MSESEAEPTYLDRFPTWLRSLGEDAERLGQLAAHPELQETSRQALVAGINYVFRSLDLVPDGIDDIGYLDDAFVLRVASEQALHESSGQLPDEPLRMLERLGEEAAMIESFLGSDYARLANYVRALRRVTVRGRSVADILHDAEVSAAFTADLRGFARGYEAPSMPREDKYLVKLRAFFDAKLPR
jgi:uncharacterized membrane protein YkvA (DUF1232 family)